MHASKLSKLPEIEQNAYWGTTPKDDAGSLSFDKEGLGYIEPFTHYGKMFG